MSIKDDGIALKLEEYVNTLKAKNELQANQQNLNNIGRSRKNAKESFIYLLLLGLEEAREAGEYNQIEPFIK